MPGIRRVPLRSPALPPPTWKHDFRYGAVPRGSTYTGSGGTYFNSSGVLTSATTNVPRFDYDPATLSPLGYLAEMASTNACTNSTNFAGSGWVATNVAAATDGTKGPDGTTNMYKITASAGNAAHYFSHTSGTSYASGAAYSISMVVKQGTERYCQVGDDGASSWHVVTYDFTGGTFTNQTNATGSVRSLGGGLYRITCAISSSSSTHNARVFVAFGPNGNQAFGMQFNAAGTETGYATCAQIDSVGVGCTSIINTSGATASRTQDVLSLPLTSLPGWSATQGGVLVAAGRLHTDRGSSFAQSFAVIGDVAGNNFLEISDQYNGGQSVDMWSGGGRQVRTSSGTPPAIFTRRKFAGGWSASRVQLAYDGTFGAGSNGSYSLPANPANLYLGGYGSLGDILNGTLESIAYYRGARSDAFVQAVSRG